MQEVTQGEYIEITFRLKDPSTGRAYNLSGYDNFKVCIPNAENGFVALTHTANANQSIVTKNVDDSLGEITAKIYPGDSDTFLTEEQIDVNIEISKSTDTPLKPLRKVFKRALYVVPFDC